jgi:phage shock protein PspC (stress-responsive transcriptional regulator)
MARSVVAIVVGFIAGAALSFGADAAVTRVFANSLNATGGTEDPTLLTVLLVFGVIFLVLPAYVTALLAPNQPVRHALVFGVLTLGAVTIGKFANWSSTPAWHNLLTLAMVIPCAVLGGWLRKRQGSAILRSS